LINQNHLQTNCDSQVLDASSHNYCADVLKLPVSEKQYLVAIVILIVACLHSAALLLMLHHSSVVIEKISPPTIVGVLIQQTSTKLVKAFRKKTIKRKAKVKPKPVPVPVPKKLVLPAKKVVESDKAITLPESIAEPERLEEPAKEQQAPIVLPRSDASHLNNRAPVYPRASLRRHEEGTVILELLVRADGTVGSVRVKESSGYQRLDNAALKAVRHWHYVPARQSNKAIDFWYQQPLVFSMRK